MLEALRHFAHEILPSGLLAELLTIGGFILAVFLVARLMSEKRAPANTFAWLLIIVLVPWVGVPLYLLIGGRKLRRLAERKSQLRPTLPGGTPHPLPFAASPIVHTTVSAGATPPVGGNSIRFLTNGEEAYAALEHHIRTARHTIHITAFILGRDDTGRRLVSLLAARAAEGVRVRLLLDSVGSMFSRRGFVNPLRRAGGRVGSFMPVLPFTSRGSANLRNHRKIAVFDHCTAITGGHNLAREYMGPDPYTKRWQDFGAVIEGPAAALINEVFIADWSFATRESAAALHAEIPPECAVTEHGATQLQVVASGPDVPGDPLYEGLIAMIQEANHSIWIVTPYFIPDDVLLRSLIVKARSGKQVTLVTPRRSNHPIADFARRHYIRELQRAGGRVLLFSPGMLHSKAMIVDDTVAMFGSPNFDLRSLFVNFEIGILVHSRADVQAMKGWAMTLAATCQPPPSERRRLRIVSNVVEDLSRLLAPLL
ncbi:phospholipase D-like domain-containing protein [Opitutus sp. ER46]|uniref:phospholipase D-like domain-containing protein n=1 Tax=Opitutus sp. ER46 TaxID=2161864 RepID=UPI000D2F53CA|nr:phospholipase D-like domain-containing protein [Opitutus sp. ER46]PTX92660.1 cardiolipin synthase [Opitutus sp. ER46]